MTAVWSYAPYSSSTLLVLLALADWANDEGACWPSIETLSKKARIERRSTQYVIRKLAKDEMIQIEEGGGRGHQHRYQINVQKLRRLASTKGASQNTERVQSDAQRVQPIAHDPLVDPSIDTSGPKKKRKLNDMSKDEFVDFLKKKPEFEHIDIDREIQKMATWVETHPGRQLTRRFVLNWLNKSEAPLKVDKSTNGHDAAWHARQAELARRAGREYRPD